MKPLADKERLKQDSESGTGVGVAVSMCVPVRVYVPCLSQPRASLLARWRLWNFHNVRIPRKTLRIRCPNHGYSRRDLGIKFTLHSLSQSQLRSKTFWDYTRWLEVAR
ncbi:uncharacterized protein LOC117897647 [Drosophila subobscura]|uniref:uncharacterized protein LOC117897647 n=1 Tax=Drosophila subobscura TaxID=7241 RepID=UPI00155AD017|nr:uncharacterized protein LOC117897647 [Drosophila subobscura]